MPTILFVDDEPRLLTALQRQLRGQTENWTLRFASGGAEALGILAATTVDVIVTDMMMGGMDGAQLLEQVLQRHPGAIRIVLSGYAAQESVLRLVCPAHQYLAKPCEADQLKATISRAIQLRDLLASTELKQLIAGTRSLPSLPALYQALNAELRSAEPSMDRIGATISRDPAMCAKILQLVNSAFFGLARSVTNPTEAAMYLGVETLKSLVLYTQAFSQCGSPNAAPPGFSLQDVARHCWNTGIKARLIAREEGLAAAVIDQCFVGALLHDIGKLVLAASHSQACHTVVNESAATGRPTWCMEKDLLGSSHAEVGAYLLGLWNLGHPIIEAVAFHHDPGRIAEPVLNCTTIVHVANVLEHTPQSAPSDLAGLDWPYLQKVGVVSRLPHWQRLCLSLEPQEKQPCPERSSSSTTTPAS
jgi:HD-like signal output (HDOD) protein